MKRKFYSIFLTTICVLSSILNSCSSGIDLSAIDDKSIKIDASLVLPIAETNLTVKSVLNKIGLPNQIDTASTEVFFHWNYREEEKLKNFDLADSLRPYDRTIMPVPSGFPPILIPIAATYPFVFPEELDIFPNDENIKRVDSILINSALVNISFSVSPDISSVLKPSDFKIEFLFDNSNLKTNDRLEYHPFTFGSSYPISLGNCTLYTKGLSKLNYNIRITINPSSPVILTTDSWFKLYVKFKDINSKVAYGFFKLQNEDSNQINVPFNVDDYIPDANLKSSDPNVNITAKPAANLKFADPNVNITATSNLGGKVNFKIEDVIAFNTTDPSVVFSALFNKSSSTTDIINGVDTFGDTINTPLKSFNSQNGGLDKLFDSKPFPNTVKFKYSISADTINFIAPDSKLKLNIDVNIPLKLKGGSYLEFKDTLHNLDFGPALKYADSALLVLKIKNGMPLRAKYSMTLYQADSVVITPAGCVINEIENESQLGNLRSEFKIKSATVDDLGNVLAVIPQTLYISLNKAQIEALKLTNYIIIHVYLDSDESTVNGIVKQNPIHITTNNSFGVKIGVYAKGSYNTKSGSSN
jgi:hypothetical protein